jgi:hypothetical protein
MLLLRDEHEVLLANANTAILTQSHLVHSFFCTITVLGSPVPNYAFKNVTTLAGTQFGSKNCIYDLYSKDIRRKLDNRDCVFEVFLIPCRQVPEKYWNSVLQLPFRSTKFIEYSWALVIFFAKYRLQLIQYLQIIYSPSISTKCTEM